MVGISLACSFDNASDCAYGRALTHCSSTAGVPLLAWVRQLFRPFFLKKDFSFYQGLGYLVGPVIGSACWRLTHRRTMNLIEEKDREFHKRIVKNRVDPTAQSATNPVPDYHGEPW